MQKKITTLYCREESRLLYSIRECKMNCVNASALIPTWTKTSVKPDGPDLGRPRDIGNQSDRTAPLSRNW
jgi:hypothetical protein